MNLSINLQEIFNKIKYRWVDMGSWTKISDIVYLQNKY